MAHEPPTEPKIRARTRHADASDRRPKVSFGLPVRNGASTIRESIVSVMEQTFEDWELVISDNLSTDGTSEICAELAAVDPRVRHVPTGRDLTQNENFCEAFRHASGRYFRWYGDDDWLEPDYSATAVTALEAAHDAVLCTTLIEYHEDERTWDVVDFISAHGGVTSDDPVERVDQLFALFRIGDLRGIDPVYALARRSVMEQTGLMWPYRFGDFIFCCEMALRGPFVHVPQLLAHRRIRPSPGNRTELERFTGRRGWTNAVQREISLSKVWQSARPLLTPAQQLRLTRALAAFFARERAHGIRRRAARLRGVRSA